MAEYVSTLKDPKMRKTLTKCRLRRPQEKVTTEKHGDEEDTHQVQTPKATEKGHHGQTWRQRLRRPQKKVTTDKHGRYFDVVHVVVLYAH